MKTLAIGCGIALLITGICAAGVAYYVYRQVSTTVAQSLSSSGRMRSMASMMVTFVPNAA